MCIPNVLLRSKYWSNNSLPPSLPQSSLSKENPLSQDRSSRWNHLKTKWFNYKDFTFGDNKLDFETNKILLMFTIEFISLTESFSCPLFEENLMIQQYHFTHILMKHLCFGLVTDLLILVSGYSEFCKFILKRFLFCYF